jgi:hypothetical protein
MEMAAQSELQLDFIDISLIIHKETKPMTLITNGICCSRSLVSKCHYPIGSCDDENLLLNVIDAQMNLCAKLRECSEDVPTQSKVLHSVDDLLRQAIYGLSRQDMPIVTVLPVLRKIPFRNCSWI